MIKKHSSKNDYLYAQGGSWVRNFTKKNVIPLDLNHFIPETDMRLLLENEAENNKLMLQQIDSEHIHHPKAIIVSDGYHFLEKHPILASLPKDVVILGVNDTVNRWQCPRMINYYVVNNPYKECLNYLNKAFPRTIASIRTNHEFIAQVKNVIYTYSPVKDQDYSGIKTTANYYIDDYRNPICAAIGLAYRFGVKKLVLFGCDDAYAGFRDGMERINNDFWSYPQQMLAQKIIDANLYWLGNSGVTIANCASVPSYKFAPYLADKDLSHFFS